MTRAATFILFPLALLAAALSLLSQSDLDWNSVRTVIPVALAHGISPYHPPGQGPLWSNIYPPLAFLLQTPAALAPTPLAAIRTTQLISALSILLPLTLILHSARTPDSSGNSPRTLLHTALLLSLAIAALISAQPLEDVTFLVHVDAPALGFALLATYFASRHRPLPAALLTSAAIFSKQTLLPLAPALFLLFLLTPSPHPAPRRPALTYLLTTALSSLAALLLCFALFTPTAFWYSTVTVSSRHPLDLSLPTALARALPLTLPLALTALALILTSLLLPPRLPTKAPPKAPHEHAGPPPTDTPPAPTTLPPSTLSSTPTPRLSHPAFPYLLVSLFLLPTALLGFMKFGGGPNNLALPLLPLIPAALLSLSCLPPTSRLTRFAFAAACLLALFTLSRHTLSLRTAPSLSRPSQHTLAYDHLRQSPGLYFFPWLPLSHFYADRSLTHQSWGLHDRQTAGETISDAWLHQYTPPHPRLLCFFRPPDQNDILFHRLHPHYPHRIPHPSLPHWYVFTNLGN